MKQENIFKALSHQSRIDVIKMCTKGATYLEVIQKKTKTEPSLLAHHLQQLKETKFVLVKKDGKKAVYYLNPKYFIDGAFRFGKLTISFGG